MCGPKTWDGGLRLGPRGGVFGMRVCNASDVQELLVEFEMGREIGGGPELGVDHGAFHIADHHVLWLQFIVGHATRFNGDQSFVAVNATRIAEGINDESASD